MSTVAPKYRPVLRACTTALAVAWAVYAVQALAGAPAGVEAVFNTYVYVGILLAAVALCMARGALVPERRGLWLSFGVGLLAWTGGELYYTFAAPETIPSLADVGYLAPYPAAYVGLVLLLRSQLASFRRSLWLDGAIVALAAASVATSLAAGPIIDASVDGDQLAVATNLAYPIGDLVLLSLVVGTLGLAGWRPGPSWILLGAGLATLALADGAYLFQAAQGTYVENGLLDVGWTLAALLVALAAWAPERYTAPGQVSATRMIASPTIATLVAVGLTTYDHFVRVHTVGLTLASATLLLVTLRMALAFRENQRMVEGSRRDATIDALTGLGNRRLLNDDLVPATAAAPGGGRTRILVMLDLDGFKSYNDSFGHPAGDSLLARMGARLDVVSRPHGRAYRLGGDEFCLLAECEGQMADVAVAAAVEALSDRGDGFAIAPSAGVVRLPDEAASPAAALQLADRRMYANKAHGRASAERQSRDVLISALRERQPELYNHVTDVAELAYRVAGQLGMSAEERDEMARAAELHDIGKVAIPDTILNKPGPLDEQEWAFMRSHTIVGERILASAPALVPVSRLVRSSHERWDGVGYPDGLRGEQIPLGARVITVCDSYEAMVADRPYRAPMTSDDALAELDRCAGSQFDPAVVTAFRAVMDRQLATPLTPHTPSRRLRRG